MSSHIYTIVGVVVCLAGVALSAYRIWQCFARGEAVVDVNYLIAWIQGRDTNLTPSGGTIEFSRQKFPLACYLVVLFWAVLGVVLALLTLLITKIGIS